MNNKAPYVSFMLVVFTTALSLGGTASATHISPPDGLVCAYDGTGTLSANWNDLAGAKRYAVEVTASYDVSGDGSADRSQRFMYKVGGSTLSMPLNELERAFFDDATRTVVSKKPMSAMLRVKGLGLKRAHHEKDGDDGDRKYKKRKYKILKLKHEKREDDDRHDRRKGHAYGHSGKNSPFSQYCNVQVEVRECPFNRC